MVRRILATLLVLGWMGGIQLCNADVEPSEYEKKQFDPDGPSSRELKRISAELEIEQKRLAELEKSEAEAEARRIAAEKAAWEALPPAARLTATRCTQCHVADNFMNQRHTRIGWELVTLRMQHLNGAGLGDGERSSIAQHLAQTYPATGFDAFIETLMQLVVLASPLALWLAYRRVRGAMSKRRQARG